MRKLLAALLLVVALAASPASATVTTTNAYVIDAGNGSTTVFSYNFLIPGSSSIDQTNAQIVYTNTSGGQTILTKSQYTISGVNNSAGGSVTYPLSGPAIPLGSTLTISRNLPYTQTTNLSNQSSFNASVVMGMVDYVTMLVQQAVATIGNNLGVTSLAVSAPLTATGSTGAITMGLGTPSNGQLLIGNGTTYVPATLTAGSNVTIVNGAGSIQISASSGGGGSSSLGTSTTAASPSISGDATSGFYTPAASTVAVAASGIEAMQWNTTSSGVNYVTVTPGTSGNPATISAVGQTNTNLALSATGTGAVSISGIYYPTSVLADQISVATTTALFTPKSLPSCLDSGGNHLNYNTSTHAFSCGTSSSSSNTINVQTFTSSGTWSTPGFGTKTLVQCWGGGGSGNVGGSGSGGGGGGAECEGWFSTSALGSTTTVTIGAGGTGVSGSTGNGGGNTTFGSYLTAYGGAGTQLTGNTGGGGGGCLGAATTGSGGAPLSSTTTGLSNPGFGGANGGVSGAGGNAAYGGGGGGSVAGTGGNSYYGGGGGGGEDGSTGYSGGTSVFGGAGGSGTTGSSGTAGTQPGGGGGASKTGTSGAGAKGECIVSTFP